MTFSSLLEYVTFVIESHNYVSVLLFSFFFLSISMASCTVSLHRDTSIAALLPSQDVGLPAFPPCTHHIESTVLYYLFRLFISLFVNFVFFTFGWKEFLIHLSKSVISGKIYYYAYIAERKGPKQLLLFLNYCPFPFTKV